MGYTDGGGGIKACSRTAPGNTVLYHVHKILFTCFPDRKTIRGPDYIKTNVSTATLYQGGPLGRKTGFKIDPYNFAVFLSGRRKIATHSLNVQMLFKIVLSIIFIQI